MLRTRNIAFNKVAASGFGRRVSIAFHESLHWILRRIDPNLSAGEFYAKTSMWAVRAGLPHKTLGARRSPRRQELEVGRNEVPSGSVEPGAGLLQEFIRLGLQPDDVVADYGCGTLRVGRHLIGYLEPGAYWGLDVDDKLLDLARTMLPPELVHDKQPHIERITTENLAACAAACPRFVISIAVMVHVPPGDIEDFCRNIATLGGPDAAYYLTFAASDVSARTSGTCWSYAPGEIEALFQRHLPAHTVTTKMGRAKGRFKRNTIHSAVLHAMPLRAADAKAEDTGVLQVA